MSIDRSILSEFIKATNDNKETKQTQIYGTVVTKGNTKCVKIDGSEIITPVRSITDIKDEERVMVSIKDHMATVTGNMTNPSVGNDRVESAEGKIDRFDHLFAGNITAENIAAGSITTDKLLAGSITTDKLMAECITSDKISANSIESKHIKSDTIESNHIKTNVIEAEHIKAGVINAEHIASGTITADKIQSGSITAGSGIIADGAIGNAQISKIDAAKIEAGTIDTSKVTIQGSNGHLRLKGNRMQVFDGVGTQAKERVSVGDVNGDGTIYGLRVRGADGQTILLDENGVKSEGITDGSITNDKISEDANIDGAKLNINSVVSKINEDGTETIQGTKIEVDGTTLETKLYDIKMKQDENTDSISQAQTQINANTNSLKLKVDEQTYTNDKKDMTSKLDKNTSEINLMKGQIALKVEHTDIENAKSELEGVMDSKINTAKSEIKVTTDAISQNVSNLSQTVSTKADGSTVTTLSNKVGSLETSVNGISGKVTNLEKTTTTLGTQVDTANTNASSALNKANSATTTANNAQNTANTNKSNITNLQGEVSTVKNNVASLEMTTSGISQKVSSVESTTATLSGKVNTAQSTADAAKSAAANAQNSANNANNALSINQQTKMNGIELFNNEYKSNTSARPFTNGDYSVVVATEISGANANESNIIKVTNGQILYTDFIACNIDNPYYASIEVYNKDTNNGTNYIQVCYYDKNKTALASNEAALNAIGGVTIPSANAWHKLEGWVNTPASNDIRRKAKYVRVRIINRYSGLSGITYWRNISWKQLGSGLLEDTQEVKVEISNTKSQVSEIKTDLNGITSRVGKVETNQTSINGQVTGLESRMSNAESKITESAITNVVKESQFIKDINGNITTNKNNISKMEQTSNSITSSVKDLEGKYTEIKQTVDGIDLTGKVSFSDLSTSGRTTINGSNITTGTLNTSKVNIKGGTTKKIVIANDNYCVYDGSETDVNRKVFMGFRTNTATNVPSVMLGYNGINPSVDGAVVSGGTYTTYSHYPNNNNPEDINLSYGALAFKYGASGTQFSTLNMYQNGDIDLKAGKSIYFRPNLRAKDNHVFAISDVDVGCRVPFKCTSTIFTNGDITTDRNIHAYGNISASGSMSCGTILPNNISIGSNLSINSNGVYTSGHITGNMVKTDSYRFTNNYIAFGKSDYNNNMMNGCNWDWQYFNLVNVKVYPVALSLPTIDEPTIQTVRETQKDTLSQIKFPEARELSVEESAPSIDISDVTNKEEITTNGDVDLIKLVYLLVKDVQTLKQENEIIKAELKELQSK